MGVEERATPDGIINWISQVRQRNAPEFVASHRCLFFLAYEGDCANGPFGFDTADFETSIAKMATAQWDQLNIRVIPITKSRRSPYLDRISIGRAPNCDIVIRHPSVSKLHAHIRVGDDGSHMVVDLGSHNGTKFGNRRLTPNNPEPLRVSDNITFGIVGVRTLDAGSLYALLSRLILLAKIK